MVLSQNVGSLQIALCLPFLVLVVQRLSTYWAPLGLGDCDQLPGKSKTPKTSLGRVKPPPKTALLAHKLSGDLRSQVNNIHLPKRETIIRFSTVCTAAVLPPVYRVWVVFSG